MTRVLVIGAVIVALAFVVLTRGDGEKSVADTFKVQLDNTFGLTDGADVRVAGVRVGSVAALDLEVRTARAIVSVDVDRPEFGGLRTDASCVVQPQSLIGEYFLDCAPGVAQRRLGDGGTVPIEQTSGTVPPDLVLNTLRRPFRERLGILLTELGAGFAARGGDVNETIGRAIPALRETNRVLAILAKERGTLEGLTRDGAATLGTLAAGRDEVARFVSQARETASVTAERRDDLAGTVRRLPAFQRALRPALADLGAAARAQTPALADLQAAAPALTMLSGRLGPFAEAARPFVRSLGEASETGVTAARAARPTVRRLRSLAGRTLEPSRNLRFVLEHLNDRSFAAEPNPESPGGKGFTGLEAFLQYPFTQSQAINLFDDRGYLLKIALLVNECSQYTNADTALAKPERTKRCSAALGPGGKLEPTGSGAATRARGQGDDGGSTGGGLPATGGRPTDAGSTGPAAPAPAPAPTPTPAAPAPAAPRPPDRTGGLLDFLLGP